MGLRKYKRKIAKVKMDKAGVEQSNKTHYKHIDQKGNATIVTRPSFFATHWRDK